MPPSFPVEAPTASVPCAVCGGTETRRLYTKFGHDIGRCVECGLVFATPRAPRETIVARYSRGYFWNEYLPALGVLDGRYDLTQFDARYAPLLELLRSAPGRRLLEIGSGAGFFLKAAERAGWSVTGIEFSEEGSRFAREELGLSVRNKAIESADDNNIGSFDAAAMFDTIEHLFDPGGALKSISNALAPGGLILIGTPNFRALSRHLLGKDWAVLSPTEHLYYFEERSLRRLVEASGFANVRFVRRHPWVPQETMNFAHTHAPATARAHLAALIGQVGGQGLARALQSMGRQDILLCLARRA